MNTYTLGVLGVGEGKSILFGAGRSERWKTRWICDLDEDLCKQRMEEHDVEKYTLSYEEMLADPELDTVAIYTPDPLHAKHCIQALDAGKHVICTKPLVDYLGDGRNLLDAVNRSGKRLMVGMSCRFFETFLQQRNIVETKDPGEFLSIEAHYHGDKRAGTSGRWGKATANNWIYTGLVHPTDLVYWYGGLAEEVFGYGAVSPAMKARGFDVPDNFHFVLKGSNGIPMTVSGLYGAPATHPESESMIGCSLRGSRYCIDARFPQFDLYTNVYEEGPVKYSRSDRHAYYYPWGGSRHHAGEFQNYLEHFAKHLDSGSQPLPDARDGLRVVATLRSMELSLESGQPVSVHETLRNYNLEELIKDR